MKKRIVGLIIAMIFVFSTTALGYQNTSYYGDIKIGLETMKSSYLDVTLNGNYKVNGIDVGSGTSTRLTISSGQINYNGNLYSEVVFEPQVKGNMLRITAGSSGYNYQGTMSFKVVSDSIIPINTIGVEDYLKGVVGYEMSNSYPLEALKAQAVAARNYTLHSLGNHRSDGYDLCDTEHNQVYRGYNASYGNVIKAVDETKGIVLLYSDKLVGGYFSASNGGYAEASENVWVEAIPYLIAKADPFDSQLWPYGDRSFTGAQVEATLKSKGLIPADSKFLSIDVNSVKKYASGRVSSIEVVYSVINGVEMRLPLVKEKVRTFLGLPSAMYSLSYNIDSDTYTFTGRGHGHGVGMSQIGAKNRAVAGQSYDTILTFYYTNSYVKDLVAKVKAFTLDKITTEVNGTVLLNAEAQNGSGSGYLYKFVVEKDGQAIFTRDYEENPRVQFTPGITGSLKVYLYIKDKLSKADYDDHRVLNLEVIEKVVVQPAPTPTPAPVQQNNTISVTRTLKRGMRGTDVVKLQNALNILGYSVGAADGSFGTKTYNAVIAFQRTKGLKRDGVVGNSTVSAINTALGGKVAAAPSNNYTPAPVPAPSANLGLKLNFSRTLKRGLRGNDVKQLQLALRSLNYNVGTPDGSFGTKTINAVKAFQRAYGLGADGSVGPQTVRKLNEILK